MIDSNTFFSIPNWLDLERHRLPVFVTKRKPVCWYNREIGHHSAIFLGKKAPEKAPDYIRNTSPPVTVKSKKEAPVVSPAVRSSVVPSVGWGRLFFLPIRLLIW